MSTTLDIRILRALTRGPLYAGTLELMCGPAVPMRLPILARAGLVKRQPRSGPRTWAITPAGAERAGEGQLELFEGEVANGDNAGQS